MTERCQLATLPSSVTWTPVEVSALIDFARVSKADGSRATDLQRDVLAKAGVASEHHRYSDAASGKSETKVAELCAELSIGRQTLYRFVGPKGGLRSDGQRLIDRRKAK